MRKYKRLWPYDINDKTTWKYIDFIMAGTLKSKTATAKYWVLNPGFMYAHLDIAPMKGNEIKIKDRN